MTPAQLHSYITLTEFLGRVLGPDYEVTLHDLTAETHPLVAIANNHISERRLGAPLPDTTLKLLGDQSYDDANYRLHYRGETAQGKILRSSSLLLRNDDGEPIGLLCINFDNSRYRQLSESLLGLCHPDAFVETNFLFDEKRISATELPCEAIAPSTSSASISIREIVARHLQERPNARRLSKAERQNIISQLEQQGIFHYKGAVKEVAEALGISQASTYRYLSQLKGIGESR